MQTIQGPKTLQEAIVYFSNPENCFNALLAIRWPDGVIPCPVCGCSEHYFLKTRQIWKCKACKKQFSVKVGTIFEASPLPLSKWLPAMWMLANCKNGISSYELHRGIGVCQKTAWFMLQRIRLAMKDGSFEKLGGHIEVDETYIGGKARNMHKDKKPGQRGMVGKASVMGFVDRSSGEVRTFHVSETDRYSMESMVFENVDQGSWLYSDQHGSYRFLNAWYRHETVDHAVEYVRDMVVHTNTLENYWSLLKRTLRGTYVSVEPFHLFRYLDEQSFRYNERKVKDADRFQTVMSQVSGRRLTYNQLTGKLQPGQ